MDAATRRQRGILAAMIMAACFVLPAAARAQSTLEYGALVTGVAAAAKGKGDHKDGGQGQGEQGPAASGASGLAAGVMTGLYGQSAQAMSSRSGSLIGQLGGGPEAQIPAPETSQANGPQGAVVQDTPKTVAGTDVTVYLKSGNVIKGTVTEQTDAYVQVDCAGIPVTYFKEEIDHIEQS